MSDFERAFAFTLGNEGGFQKDPKDRGNWTSGVIGQGELKGTKYGISAARYPTLDIENLTLDEAEAIYERDYWKTANCDVLDWPMNALVFDFAVHSGPGRARAHYAVGMTPADYVAARLRFLTSLTSWDHNSRGWARRMAACLQLR